MRLLIRPEQMSAINSSAEEKFVRRLGGHIRDNYAKSIVRLPEDQETAIRELSEEALDTLVRAGIQRARAHKLSYESSISAFTALMFEVAPNFDTHELVEPLLADENTPPDARLDPVLEKLTEKDWETVKKAYDAEAWKSKSEAEE
jgi:hypothetical protein